MDWKIYSDVCLQKYYILLEKKKTRAVIKADIPMGVHSLESATVNSLVYKTVEFRADKFVRCHPVQFPYFIVEENEAQTKLLSCWSLHS